MEGPFCSECEAKFSPRRAILGYTTCLECGGVRAEKRREKLSRQTAPAYNKGAYQFITGRQAVKDLGR